MRHGKWTRAAAAAGVAAAGSGLAAAASLPVPPTTIGINLSSPAPYRASRAFANLVLGSNWQLAAPKPPPITPDQLDKDGNLLRLPNDIAVYRMLNQPAFGSDATIRCTFAGRGMIKVAGSGVRGNNTGGANDVTFHWVNNGSYGKSLIMLKIIALDQTNPIRDLDCREANMPRNIRFEPHFLDFVRQFKVIRFMDWQNTNNNAPVTWGTRHTPSSVEVRDQDGVSVEDMVDLATQTNTDAWFNMPWNADDDYVRRFAQYVHDHLPRDRHVYVEAGNEVWNAQFPASKQAKQEGVDEGLSPNPEDARLFRYAEKLTQVMDIWAKVFADRPGQLIRVANCQNGPNRSNQVLAYKDTAKHIDALATAPYFGFDLRINPPTNTDEAFARMNDLVDKALDSAGHAKAVAYKFGKRYIAYEAGQHIILRKDKELPPLIQRDPRMYDAYKRYLDTWREKFGDTIMMFDSVQPIVGTGSWGLLEYLGQPVADAPKMRAVSDALHQAQR
ncbi:MAG TPA: hypothetical protein VK533_04255 [Sphingomonas sp.]|uniref:hypothetical protein n=1 Tax=Sphingomonas sp. TaxID=28214 RepID=UPI002C464E52|nr:hypothetical protein [Sphingomonas sp.]HMI18737.1 hypothetical protein [Sphingomonas sp.]